MISGRYSHLIISGVLLCFFLCSPAFVRAGEKKELLLHGGAGQRSSLDELVEVYHDANPDITISVAYKGSGYLLAGIAGSRQGDLFMPGEEFYMQQAVADGLVNDYDPQKHIVAHFITVIITPKGNPANVRSISDFARPGVKVGLGDSKACAIGLWHEKIFRKAGIMEAVRNNATQMAKCIPELGNSCQLGAVDATIVWATTAILYLRDVEIIPIEPPYGGAIRLPVAVLDCTKDRAESLKVRDFMLSEPARQIFRKHAYIIDPGPLDAEGFIIDAGRSAADLEWLVKAAAVAKDSSIPVNVETCGPYLEEVVRQRAAFGL